MAEKTIQFIVTDTKGKPATDQNMSASIVFADETEIQIENGVREIGRGFYAVNFHKDLLHSGTKPVLKVWVHGDGSEWGNRHTDYTDVFLPLT